MTEGERKTLAVVDAAGTRYFAIGVAGAWSWRESDKVVQPTADRPGRETVRQNSRPIADLDRVVWKGRTAYVIFDSDAATNIKVQAAECAPAAELKHRGASVRPTAFR